MLLARSAAFGTMIVSQSRVSIDRVPPADLPDLALLAVLELDPVAVVDRAVELQRDAAEDVAERRLQRDREHGADHRARGNERREVTAAACTVQRIVTM